MQLDQQQKKNAFQLVVMFMEYQGYHVLETAETRRLKEKQACQQGSLVPACEVPYRRANSFTD